jgi:hypothetical protein
LPAVAVAWGPWEGSEATELARSGIAAMPPWRALDELAPAITGRAAAVAIADLDWAQFGPRYAETRHRPLISELISELIATADPLEADRSLSSEQLARLSPEAAEEALLALVRGDVAMALGRDAADVAADRDFGELGLDSLRGLELRNRLSRALGRGLPVTLALEHPTPRRLARALLADLPAAPGAEVPPVSEANTAVQPSASRGDRDGGPSAPDGGPP